MESTRTYGLSTVHFPSVILHGTPVILLMVSLSHLSRGPHLRISLALNTPTAFPIKHSALLPRIPSQTPYLISGVHSVPRFCGDSSCQHLLSKRNKLLWWLLSVHSLKWRLSISTFLAPGQDAPGVLHQPRYERRLVSCVHLSKWHLIVLVIPRSSIIAFSMRPFDFCFAQCSYTISERNYCKLCVALQCNFSISQQVDKLCHSLDCPWFFNSILLGSIGHSGWTPFHEEIIHGNDGPPGLIFTLLFCNMMTSTAPSHHTICTPVSERHVCCFMLFSLPPSRLVPGSCSHSPILRCELSFIFDPISFSI